MTVPLYATTDSYLAAFLAANGAVFDHLHRLSPKKVAYHFISDPRVHGLLRLYWSGADVPMVPARFAEAHRRLKCLSIARDK